MIEHPPTCYCVLHIPSEGVAYLGKSLFEAANCLEPGCCFGKGLSREQAMENAHEVMAGIKSNGKGK